MDILFEEKQVEELAEKVLGKVKQTIKDDIADKLYTELSAYLYEHYTNATDKIKQNLVDQITEEFVKNPMDYKFAKLREKLFQENKDEIVKLLTDEQIFLNVEMIIWDYSHREHSFKWKWEEAVSKFIIKHIDDFKDNERIQAMFGRENDRLKRVINALEAKIKEIEDVLI